MNRRNCLKGLSVVVPALAGCTGGPDAVERAELGEVEVWNRRRQPETVQVRVLDAGQTVFETAVEVAGYDPEEDTTGFAELDEGWPARPGDYALEAGVVGGSASSTADLVTRSGVECVEAMVILEADGLAVFTGRGCPG